MARVLHVYGSQAAQPGAAKLNGYPTQRSQPTARDCQRWDDRGHVKLIQPDGGGTTSLGR